MIFHKNRHIKKKLNELFNCNLDYDMYLLYFHSYNSFLIIKMFDLKCLQISQFNFSSAVLCVFFDFF